MEMLVTMGISLGLGFLIGLQRERAEARLGGIRTFPLIALFGSFCGFIAEKHGVGAIVAGLFTVFGVLAVSNFLRARQEDTPEPGQTTEIAALLTFALGTFLVSGQRAIAIVAAGVTMVLLHLKQPMHRFVEKMGEQDLRALMQFVVISLIILPLLPNRTFDAYNVLNPFDIWRMVVLIVGISLIAYVAYKVLGEKIGTLLSGILGGLISSTATTVSYARRAKLSPGAHGLAVFVIMIASTVSFLRVLIEIAVVAPNRLAQMALPLMAMFLWMGLISTTAYWIYREQTAKIEEPSNPAELRSALAFGAIYAVVLFAVGVAKQHFGETALYGVALLSGLTDMDAITLSIALMAEQNRIDSAQAWRLIMAASLSNLVFKTGAVALLGTWRLTAKLVAFVALGAVGGLALLWFWPQGWTLD